MSLSFSNLAIMVQDVKDKYVSIFCSFKGVLVYRTETETFSPGTAIRNNLSTAQGEPTVDFAF